MKKALITGITGQDGAYLSRSFWIRATGSMALVTDYDYTQLANLKQVGVLDRISLVSGDLIDLVQLRDRMEELRPDEVYHLAAQSSVAQSFQTPVATVAFNIQSPQHLLESIRPLVLPARFYQAASRERYGRSKPCRSSKNPSSIP
jgi:GDPmannose 4,6-dehydratase